MTDTIAQLDIQITSTATAADSAITALEAKIGKLSSTLSSVDGAASTSGFAKMASSIGVLKDATESVNSSKMKEVASALDKMAKAADSISTTGVANISLIADAMRKLSGLTFADFSGLSRLIESMTKIGGITFDASVFSEIGVSVRTLASSLVGTPEVSENLIKLLSAVARFGSSGMSSAASNIGAISVALDELFHSLSTVPAVREDVLRLVEALSHIPPSMTEIRSSSGEAASGFNLADVAMKAFKSTVKDFMNIAKKAGSAIKQMWTDATKSISKGFMSGPIGDLLKFAATFLTIRKAWEGLKDSISNASALIEIQNVINSVYTSAEQAYQSVNGTAQNAAQHLDELAKSAIHSYGISELAFKKYASQFQAMSTALSITDEQVAAAEKNLSDWGVMVSKVKDPVTGVNKAFGTMTGQMSDVSFTLTQLAGDIASFYDKDIGDVQKMLASGIYAGQTRPLTLAA